MKILLIFTLCLISDGEASKEVKGYSGGGVLIKCTYDTKFVQNNKHFCKSQLPGCFDEIKTEAKDVWINSGRFSMYDDTKSAEFWVMIRDLTVQDTGMYQCGVDIDAKRHVNTLVELKVKKDLSYKESISETAHVNGDLTISCKYPKSIMNGHKFLCKRLQTADCSYNATVKESRKAINEGRLTLYDDRERQIFTVSIRNVTVQDPGEYWCGAEVNWKSDHGYKVYFTQINLTVTGFSYITVIIVSVSLLVILVGIIILIVTLHRKHKIQGPKAMTQTFNESSQIANQSDSVYQNQNSRSDSVYQSLISNTNQSDSVYQSLISNTNQSDSVYQSLISNTKQSDSVYQSLTSNTKQSNSVY